MYVVSLRVQHVSILTTDCQYSLTGCDDVCIYIILSVVHRTGHQHTKELCKAVSNNKMYESFSDIGLTGSGLNKSGAGSVQLHTLP
jgi:hypothetical protein